LTLRTNGTFRVDISGADVGCYFSGHYQKGDTILLDKNVIEQTHSTFATQFFLLDGLLIAIVDTGIKNDDKVDTLYIANRLSGVQQLEWQ